MPSAESSPEPVLAAGVQRLRFATQAPWIEVVLPWRGGSWGSNLVVRTHMEPLIDVDHETTELVPMLAESWEMTSPDATEWTFHLRKGVPFHDGWGEFTARDVPHVIARNAESQLSTDGPSFRAKYGESEAEVMRQVEIVDDYTVKLKPMSPDVDLDLTASSQYGNFLMHSKAQWDAVGPEGSERQPAGTGAYRLVDRQVGTALLWQRVADHWRKVPDFPEFEMLLVTEEATRMAMLLGHEVQMTELPRDLHETAVNQGFAVFSTVNPVSQTFFVFGGIYAPNVPEYAPDDPLNNIKVREAINRAVDRDLINQEIFKGVGDPLKVLGYHPNLPGWNPRWQDDFQAKYGFDPARSRELLAEAGYPEGFDLKLFLMHFPGYPETTALNEYMFTALRDIGIGVEIEEIEVARYRQEFQLARKSQGTMHTRRTSFTTPMVVNRWYNAQPPLGNYGSYELPDDIQQKFDAAFGATSKEAQAQFLREIGDFKFDNYSEVPLFWIPGQAVVDPRVISEYVWPGNVDAGFDHFEYIKATRQ
jgi:ABC-type transport system substrate-binding protein